MPHVVGAQSYFSSTNHQVGSPSMDILQFIDDKHHILAKLGDNAAKISKAFHEQGNVRQ